MRTQQRNKAEFLYSTFSHKSQRVDGYGRKYGEYDMYYNPVAKEYGNVSPAKGSAQLETFGVDTKYSRVIVLPGTNHPITETTRFWLDIKAEEYDELDEYTEGDIVFYESGVYKAKTDTTGTFTPSAWEEIRPNYAVSAVAVSIGTTSIALTEVK